jgi:hypothetical protein
LISSKELIQEVEKEAERLRALPPARESSSLSAGDGPLKFVDTEISPGDVGSVLRFDGRDFLRMAYVAVMRRQIDSDGEDVYLHALEGGMHKMEIILRLRFSPEGRKQRVRLRGAFVPICDLALSRLPIIGYIYRVLKEIVLLPRTMAEMRMRIEKIRDHINRLSDD